MNEITIENETTTAPLDGRALDGLRMLEALAAQPEDAQQMPRRVPFEQIEMLGVFDNRTDRDERKVTDLVQVLDNGGKLPALTVLRVGARTFLVDGHYRLEAFRLRARKMGRETNFAVPVSWFDGTPADAIFASIRTNCRHGAQLTTSERTDAAWKLVLIGEKNRTEMIGATGVSRAWLSKMRRVKRELGVDAADYPSWPHALGEVQGRTQEPLSDDDFRERKQAMANKITDQITKNIGSQHADDPVLMAMVMEAYMGRRLPELVRELREMLPEGEELDDFGDF